MSQQEDNFFVNTQKIPKNSKIENPTQLDKKILGFEINNENAFFWTSTQVKRIEIKTSQVENIRLDLTFHSKMASKIKIIKVCVGSHPDKIMVYVGEKDQSTIQAIYWDVS